MVKNVLYMMGLWSTDTLLPVKKRGHDFIFKNKYACMNNLTAVVFQFLSVFHQINSSVREICNNAEPNSFIDSFSFKFAYLTAAAFCVCTHEFLIPQERMASAQDTVAMVLQANAWGWFQRPKGLTANAAMGCLPSWGLSEFYDGGGQFRVMIW